MVTIKEMSPSCIELKSIKIDDGAKVRMIMDICHKYKHLYKDGYPCGRKTRKESKIKMEKWEGCPGICFTYLITDDTENHNLAIHVLVSDIENLRKRLTEREINYYTELYTQDVAEEILKLF